MKKGKGCEPHWGKACSVSPFRRSQARANTGFPKKRWACVLDAFDDDNAESVSLGEGLKVWIFSPDFFSKMNILCVSLTLEKIFILYSKPRIYRIQVDRQIYPSYAKIWVIHSDIKGFVTIVREISFEICEDPTYATPTYARFTVVVRKKFSRKNRMPVTQSPSNPPMPDIITNGFNVTDFTLYTGSHGWL